MYSESNNSSHDERKNHAQGSSPSDISLSDFLDEQVYPALFTKLNVAMPEFGWKRQGPHWIASVWPPSFPEEASERKPSRLMVYANRKHWIKVHGKTGVRFLDYVNGGQNPRGIAFIEAARRLAAMAEVDFPDRHVSPEEEERRRQRELRREALDVTFDYCQDQLFQPAGKAALDYLIDQRHLPMDATKNLGLGFYASLGGARAALKDAGLPLASPDTKVLLWPKIEGYITYPWHDAAGRPLTLYGRWPGSPPDGKPKTIALPGDGSKGSPLYFDRARNAGHRHLVLVEGVNDAAMLQAHGDTRVVACVGALLNGEQVKTLVRYQIEAVTICLDPDGGGDRGTLGCIKSLENANIRAFVAPRLPDHMDPDEFVIANGIEAWQKHIAAAEHSFRFMAKQIIAKSRGEGWTDQSRSECLAKAGEFAHEQPSRAADLDLHFWPEFASALGIAVEFDQGAVCDRW